MFVQREGPPPHAGGGGAAAAAAAVAFLRLPTEILPTTSITSSCRCAEEEQAKTRRIGGGRQRLSDDVMVKNKPGVQAQWPVGRNPYSCQPSESHIGLMQQQLGSD